MLTLEEITGWDPVISKSNDTSLIREFYAKIGMPEKIKEIFKKSAESLAKSGLLQTRVKKCVYVPELSKDELREIAYAAVKQDILRGNYRNALSKLDDEIYREKISDAELGTIVNGCIREDKYGNDLGRNPDNFAGRLVQYRTEGSLYEDVYSAYFIFDRYKNFVLDGLNKNIVTLEVFSNIVSGNFKQASKIKIKQGELCDDGKLAEWTGWLVQTLNLDKNYAESDYQYACRAAHSKFAGLFAEASLDAAALEKPEKESKKSYIQQLNEAFGYVEDDFGILAGISGLKLLLKQTKKIKKTGKSVVKKTLQERVDKAMDINPFGVCELLQGYDFDSCGDYSRIGGVGSLLDAYVIVNEHKLLNAMLERIEWTSEKLLSDDYSFKYDNLTFFKSPSEICTAYNLHLNLASKGYKHSKKEDLERIVFLKIALCAKRTYDGEGMREISKVLNEPANKEYLDFSKLKKLFEKVFKEGFEEGFVNWDYVREDKVSYFYQLVNSPLGEYFKDDKRLEKYFRLHEFLTSKSNKIQHHL